MKPYFSTPERITLLEYRASLWVGTPFMPNAAIMGAGVSCQKLVCAVLKESGALPKDFEVPEGPMAWSQAQTESLIEKFMSKQTQYFAEIPLGSTRAPRVVSGASPETSDGSAGHVPSAVSAFRFPHSALPGDMLGIHIGGCVHHCGVVLNTEGLFIHCLRQRGTIISNIRDATYSTRIHKIWRPIQPI